MTISLQQPPNELTKKVIGSRSAQQFYTLLMGTVFGLILVKSELISWFRIQKMFRFEEAHMYLIIGSAVVVGALSIQLIKRLQLKTVDQQAVQIKTKPFQKGTIVGGILFGAGWAITGACPGPIYAQLGSGEPVALVTFIAALTGMYLYAYLQPKLPH